MAEKKIRRGKVDLDTGNIIFEKRKDGIGEKEVIELENLLNKYEKFKEGIDGAKFDPENPVYEPYKQEGTKMDFIRYETTLYHNYSFLTEFRGESLIVNLKIPGIQYDSLDSRVQRLNDLATLQLNVRAYDAGRKLAAVVTYILLTAGIISFVIWGGPNREEKPDQENLPSSPLTGYEDERDEANRILSEEEGKIIDEIREAGNTYEYEIPEEGYRRGR